MAQINLLKQSASSSSLEGVIPGILAKLLIVVLVGVLGYYAWLYVKIGGVNRKILSVEQEIAAEKKNLAAQKDRNELLTRQQQLNSLDSLITAHPYWSQLLPVLAKATLKTASYKNIASTRDGHLVMSVKLPDLIALDKFLQVFDLPEIISNFSDVSIGAYHKVADGDKTSIIFDVRLKFDAQLLQYQNKTGGF